MKLLGIDTSTMTASAAVLSVEADSATVLAAGDRRVVAHSEILLPLIDELVRAAGLEIAALDAIAVGAGPGSFTGLRIGMATAKGLAFGGGKPLWAVSSLAAMALAIGDGHGQADGLLVPVLDARRGEVFAGFYRLAADGATVVAAGPERVFPPADLAPAIAQLLRPGERSVLAGDALAVYPAIVGALPGARDDLVTTPSAVCVARLAAAGTRADVLVHGSPVYIRPSEAEVKYPDGIPKGLKRPKG
jgi:tRNA threonylcarbamoyladenosine biosynthesis protein TsaB